MFYKRGFLGDDINSGTYVFLIDDMYNFVFKFNKTIISNDSDLGMTCIRNKEGFIEFFEEVKKLHEELNSSNHLNSYIFDCFNVYAQYFLNIDDKSTIQFRDDLGEFIKMFERTFLK